MVQEKNKAFAISFYYGICIVFIIVFIIVGLILGTIQKVTRDKNILQETTQVKKS